MTVFKKSILTLSIAAVSFSAVLIICSMAFMNYLYYEINTTELKNTAKTLFTAIGEDSISKMFFSFSQVETINEDTEALKYHQVNLAARRMHLSSIINNSGAYRLTLIDPYGSVLWDSHVTAPVNHLDREEVQIVLQGNEASARRNSITRGNQEIYYALPVFNDSGVIGVFRLSVSVPSFGVRISPVIPPFIIYSCLLAVIAFLAILAYSKSLADSVGRLVSIAQSGAPFLSGPEAEEHIAPEFRSLEKALRAMTAELNMRFEQAKKEGSRLEAILNGMSEAVFAMDFNLKLHLVNPRARELFNIGNFNDIEAGRLSLLEATRSAELEDIAKKALSADASLETKLTFRTGGAFSEKFDLLQSKIQDRHFQVYAAPLSNTNNPESGVVLVLQDITRLVKLERVRKDFVANVSHELRTPIQLIKGFSETLLDEVTENSLANANGGRNKIIHFIEIIQKNAGNMENLTNDLLLLAELENNDDDFNRKNIRDMEEVLIAPLINEAVLSVELSAKRKNIEIIIDCPEGIKAKLIRSFIVQALINLIDNGIKYSPEKSKIWVTGKQISSKEKTELVLEVRDNGIGIPKEHIERIFERFYRVDKARSRDEGGTGLGLSIVRHIALLHGGEIEAESACKADGRSAGSTLRLRIPSVLH